MALSIEVYETRHVPMARAFNERLVVAGIDSPVLLSSAPNTHNPSLAVSTEARVVVDGASVRGGYLLQWRDAWIHGTSQRVCAMQSPVSEGIVDRRYALVGPTILRHALTVNPLLYAVGMGGIERPLPRLLKSLGFSIQLVPFFFRVNRPRRFLRNINHLRRSAGRRAILDFLSLSGLGWIIRGAQLLRAFPHRDRTMTWRTVDSLHAVADRIWDNFRASYSFACARDNATLEALYPVSGAIQRLEVWRSSQCIGWALVTQRQMRANKYFGDMRVGVIADCFSKEGDAASIIAAATAVLEHSEVDLIVCNFQHAAWRQACILNGFLSGPSNHVLALSPQLSTELKSDDPALTRFHLSRGDSDGLVNL